MVVVVVVGVVVESYSHWENEGTTESVHPHSTLHPYSSRRFKAGATFAVNTSKHDTHKSHIMFTELSIEYTRIFTTVNMISTCLL